MDKRKAEIRTKKIVADVNQRLYIDELKSLSKAITFAIIEAYQHGRIDERKRSLGINPEIKG